MSEAIPLADFVAPDECVDRGTLAVLSEADACVPTTYGNLRVLIDDPCRSLEVEYKGWRNLKRAEGRGTGGPQPGHWLSPNALAQEPAEPVRHARVVARMFGGVRRVCFRCEWWGLAGRGLYDPSASWVPRGPSGDDHRLVPLRLPSAGLVEGWAEAVAQLIAPVVRNFEPDLRLGADWGRAQSQRWQSSGAT